MRVGRAAALGLLLALGGCTAPQPRPAPSRPPPTVVEVAARHVDGLPARPEDSAFAREVYRVTSLAEMVQLSDLVLVGRAIAIAPGRSAGGAAGGGLRWRDVGVEVVEAIHGDYDGVTLTLEEFGW